jgi:hypothetical protein
VVLLFVANAVSINAVVLVTGALASVILGPIWWLSIAALLWQEPTGTATRGLAGPAMSVASLESPVA